MPHAISIVVTGIAYLESVPAAGERNQPASRFLAILPGTIEEAEPPDPSIRLADGVELQIGKRQFAEIMAGGSGGHAVSFFFSQHCHLAGHAYISGDDLAQQCEGGVLLAMHSLT